MSQRTGIQRRAWQERALSLLLAVIMLIGLVPAATLPASAEHWADAYLDQLVDWGIIRADQTANPDAPLTRAEFMAIINRAYGYTETGPIPFEDVLTTDWFHDDVAIAYNAGYMAGTSDITASPNDTLTREQAICILGRNMMMKDTPGESLAFSDSRDVSDWARGTIKTAVDNYIISGYPDNTFQPQAPISKGQMAALITGCLGTPVQSSGTYELGGVFGNVTITSPDVTLRNTTISGDLYVSGGVGLGGIKLENVNVLGRIIISGTGESEGGGASVIMRNVAAEEMLVDNMRGDKTVTIRADGITNIANTVVRTNAYLEDNNTDANGLMHIELDGESGTRLTLAGRIKEVVDKTPNSYVQVAKGTVARLNVDEAAANSTVQLDRNTEVKEMNLDVATNVTGDGDIGKLNINAPGSTVSMLPEDTYIRPGLTGNIAGVVMDHVAAEEGSLDPMLLSGYPAAKDITPTGLRADFAGNKIGTIYWAVSNITDGSVTEDDLISPPSYGSIAISNGSLACPAGGQEVSAQISGLTVGGSYYLSAILVDGQGVRSPVKVISFSTPDDTVPAFGQGYPYMSFIGKESPYDAFITAQVTVLPNKSCKMYYAVLPAGAAAPTVNDLRASAVSANVGYGVVDLTKNLEEPFPVSRRLEQQKDYVLYMWLTDGSNSSQVLSLPFSTPDVTPPEFLVHPYVNGQPQATSVPMAATLSENGTIFWAVVESGTDYPKPNPQNPDDNSADGRTALLESNYAKIQVANGMNALRSGRVTATANTEAAMNITGLTAEKSYDLYYLAQDAAGNYTIQVYQLDGDIHTLDTSGPKIRQYFTKYSGTDETKDPTNDTDIVLEFSENICFASASGRDLLSLYEASRTDESIMESLVSAMKESIVLYQRIAGIGARPVIVREYPADSATNWVIDYSAVRVENEEGKVRMIFPSSGLQLSSGGTYYFEISNITDNSVARNKLTPATVRDDEASRNAGHSVPEFTVVFAEMFLSSFDLVKNQWPKRVTDAAPEGEYQYNVDFSFRMVPNTTHTVQDGIGYDLILWTDTTLEYDLYYRVVDSSGNPLTSKATVDGMGFPTNAYALPNLKKDQADDNGWVFLKNSGRIYTSDGRLYGKSLQNFFCDCKGDFPNINLLDDSGNVYYEFAISINRVGNSGTGDNPATWSGDVRFYVNAAAGTSNNLFSVSGSNNVLEETWDAYVERGLGQNGIASIGTADNRDDPKRLAMLKTFTDSLQPSFAEHYPNFKPSSNSVTLELALDRPGTVKYAIAAASQGAEEPEDESEWVPVITTRIQVGAYSGDIKPSYIPKNGDEARVMDKVTVTLPDKGDINEPESWEQGSSAITGTINNQAVSMATEVIEGLESNRTYYAYFVILGSAQEPSEIHIFKFKTEPTVRPKIDLGLTGNGVNMTITNMDANLRYLLYLEDDLKNIMLGESGDGTTVWMDTPLTEVAENANEIPAAYRNYTIMQALQGIYSGGASDPNVGYSIFDLYASPDAKKLYVDWITSNRVPPGMSINPNASTIPASHQQGNHTMRQGTAQEGATNARPGAIYYILTMARGVSTTGQEPVESIYSFRALQVIITDREPPMLTNYTGNITVENSSGRLLSGSLVLTFNKRLYTRSGTEITNANAAQFFGGSSLPTGVASVDIAPGADATTVRIALGGNGVLATDLLAVVPAQYLSNSGGSPAPESLTVEVQYRIANPGGQVERYGYFLVVRWSVSQDAQPIIDKEASYR